MNIEKSITDELLKNIKTGDNFEISELSKLFCKRIVGVRFKAGRGRMVINASDRLLGISSKTSSSANDFRKNNIKSGTVLFFPDETIRNFDNLFSNIRQCMTRYSISKEGNIYYMTTENYVKFKNYFEEVYVKSLHDKKEDLISKIDIYKNSFKTSLESWLDETIDDDKDRASLLKYYVSCFPTKEEFEMNCKMELLLSSYPVVMDEQFVGVNSTIAKDIKDSSEVSAVETLYNMIYNNLVEAFKITEKMISTIDVKTSFDGSRLLSLNIGSRTKGLLNQTIDYLRSNNYLLKNDFIDDVLFILNRTFINKEDVKGNKITNNQAIEVSENLLALIYGYVNHIGMSDEFEDILKTSDYDAETLEIISSTIEINDI